MDRLDRVRSALSDIGWDVKEAVDVVISLRVVVECLRYLPVAGG